MMATDWVAETLQQQLDHMNGERPAPEPDVLADAIKEALKLIEALTVIGPHLELTR